MTRLRVVGFALVRNEEDVIEASIRHNLRSLDAIDVVDHGSDDATPAILEALLREGLPITVRRDDAIAFRQGPVTTASVRALLAAGADVVIPIDADEFLRMPSREAFDRAVSDADRSLPIAIRSITYLPSLDDAGGIAARLGRARRPAAERHGPRKVLVTRGLLDMPDAEIGAGNHAVRRAGHGELAPAEVGASIASIAHVPIRSVGQFVAKVALGTLASRLADPGDGASAHPWQEEFDALLAGQAMTPQRLAGIAANYGVAPGQRVDPASVAWVDDPFIGEVELRYTPATPPNPLARILSFGERVAAEVARETGGL